VGVQLKKRMKRSPRSKEFEVLGAWLRECFWLENGEGPPSVPRDVAAAVFFGERAKGAFGAARPVAEAAVKFDAGACFADGTRERLGDLDLVLRGEMDGLLDCARRSFPQWKSSVPRSGDAAADLIEACVRVRTGISQQYLYRSLYAAQLHRCLRGGVDRRDVLVLDSAELRSQPQAALDVVSDRAGLPRHAFAAAELTDAALKAEIDARFPDFENNGWRLDAEYTAPMPEALRSDLAQFFAPHNELLFAWTGERLDWPAH